MKVILDATCLGRKKTGNETYIRGLLRGYEEMDKLGLELHILTTQACPDDIKSDRFHWHEIPQGNFFSRNLISIPRYLKKLEPDLYHASYWTKFWDASPPKIVMIHDISFVSFPQGFHKHEQWFYATVIEQVAKKADHILTVSNFSKENLMEKWALPEDKITVTYNGVDDCFKPAINQNKEACQDRAPYILYVGNLHPRKNLVRLLKAFVEIKKSYDFQHKLKIVGQAAWLFEDIFHEVKQSGLEDSVEFTGYIPQDELVELYQNAELTCYPSLFEGFGLPILEAMSCGCPVVTSNTTSIPEVAGQAALLVNPESVEEIAHGIIQILQSESLRNDLRLKSIKQSQCFTWKDTALKTIEAYNRE